MSFNWKRIALGAVAALALGSAAQATEVSVTVRANTFGAPQRIADYSGDLFEHRQYRRSEQVHEHRNPDRFYGRPVPDWRDGGPHRGGYHGIPVVERRHWQRPVFAGPHRDYRDTCRIIIKDRVNRWGELVRVRREICR